MTEIKYTVWITVPGDAEDITFGDVMRYRGILDGLIDNEYECSVEWADEVEDV